MEDVELDLEFDLDEIEIDVEPQEPIDTSLPKVYLYIENLVMKNQVKGLVDDPGDLVTVPAYADKNGEPALIGIIELTAHNILTMQLLGLKCSLIREGKDSILFDKADDFVAIVKTLKQSDTVEIEQEYLEQAN